jgi:hypothetical protein
MGSTTLRMSVALTVCIVCIILRRTFMTLKRTKLTRFLGVVLLVEVLLVAILSGCADPAGASDDGEGGSTVILDVPFDPTIPSLFVRDGGSDGNDGQPDRPFKTLDAAYAAALYGSHDPAIEQIVVLSDIDTATGITFDPVNAISIYGSFYSIDGIIGLPPVLVPDPGSDPAPTPAPEPEPIPGSEPLPVVPLITITSDNGHRTLTRAGYAEGSLSGIEHSVVTVSGGAKVVFKNITIDGRKDAATGFHRALEVSGAGTEVTLETGAVLSGKTSGGGWMNRTFTAELGTVIGMNSGPCGGGGVFVHDNGIFTMNGGTVSGTAVDGGGVFVETLGKFMMKGGTINGSTAAGVSDTGAPGGFGGGVYIEGRYIHYSDSQSYEGGIFEMNSGTVSGCTAEGGGGVYVNFDYDLDPYGSDVPAKFKMTGGIIYGLDAVDPSLRNNTPHPSNPEYKGNGAAVILYAAQGIYWIDDTITSFNPAEHSLIPWPSS